MIFQGGGGPDPLSPLWIRTCSDSSIYWSNPFVLHNFSTGGCVSYHMGLDVRIPVFRVCEQHRRRPACATAQSDQCPCYSRFGKHHIKTCYQQNFNFPASLSSWGAWSESRFVGNPKDRFCRNEAHVLLYLSLLVPWVCLWSLIVVFTGRIPLFKPIFVYRLICQIHTGKCIRRFGGIYAYCRYFIDRQW